MAEQFTCVCGRKFHISGGTRCQCRGCGRWWVKQQLSPIKKAMTLLLGGEVAQSRRMKGTRKRSKKRSSRGKQTGKKRPANNPVGAAWRLFFG